MNDFKFFRRPVLKTYDGHYVYLNDMVYVVNKGITMVIPSGRLDGKYVIKHRPISQSDPYDEFYWYFKNYDEAYEFRRLGILSQIKYQPFVVN